jgi:hypothetical protein
MNARRLFFPKLCVTLSWLCFGCPSFKDAQAKYCADKENRCTKVDGTECSVAEDCASGVCLNGRCGEPSLQCALQLLSIDLGQEVLKVDRVDVSTERQDIDISRVVWSASNPFFVPKSQPRATAVGVRDSKVVSATIDLQNLALPKVNAIQPIEAPGGGVALTLAELQDLRSVIQFDDNSVLFQSRARVFDLQNKDVRSLAQMPDLSAAVVNGAANRLSFLLQNSPATGTIVNLDWDGAQLQPGPIAPGRGLETVLAQGATKRSVAFYESDNVWLRALQSEEAAGGQFDVSLGQVTAQDVSKVQQVFVYQNFSLAFVGGEGRLFVVDPLRRSTTIEWATFGLSAAPKFYLHCQAATN